eukprot:TRINITY_DN2034_c0_g5_i1.p1 TRINITY_DN2034_c0_g5~~TRINITY_DN2034_c0_g5_i1.p1  ORF type:complete len:357 (-),score=74.05 TRINITY_DN2034_c0_g5_i1:18-1022(-)
MSTFEYPRDWKVFSEDEHKEFLSVLQNTVQIPAAIAGRSVSEMVIHAKGWLHSLIESGKNKDVQTHTKEIGSSSTSSSSIGLSLDKKRKFDNDQQVISYANKYSLLYFPTHILHQIVSYLHPAYRALLRESCSKLYLVCKVLYKPPTEFEDFKNYCTEFAQNGDLNCLKFARFNNWMWDRITLCVAAAENGHLDCLQYAHENGCEWDEKTTTAAIQNDHLECFQYAKENGCKVSRHIGHYVGRSSLRCLKFLVEGKLLNSRDGTPIYSVVENGRLDCLEYLCDKGFKLDKKTCDVAAKDHLQCVKFLIDNGFAFDKNQGEKMTTEAAACGRSIY